MLKKLVLALVLALPFSALAQKFGVVDVESVFTSMPEFTTMQTTLSDLSKKYEAEYQKLTEQINKLQSDFQTVQNDPNTPESIKERRIQEIQETVQKAEQFANTAQQDISRQQQTLMQPIQSRIMEAVQSVGAEGSYTFIFPKDPAMLMYTGGDVTDVTPAVREKLGLK